MAQPKLKQTPEQQNISFGKRKVEPEPETPQSLIDWVSESSFVKISLWRRQARIVEDVDFSHKIDYAPIF